MSYEFKVSTIEDWQNLTKCDDQINTFIDLFEKEIFSSKNTGFDRETGESYFTETSYKFTLNTVDVSEEEKIQIVDDIAWRFNDRHNEQELNTGVVFSYLAVDHNTYTIEMDYSKMNDFVVDCHIKDLDMEHA